MRAKYKVGDKVSFSFAGSSEVGTIVGVRKESKDIKYSIKDDRYTYPVLQQEVKLKL